MRKYCLAIAASLLFPNIAQACEPNPYSYQTLTRDDWTEIQMITKSSGTSVRGNREPVMKSDITSIIGFTGNCSTSADSMIEKCIWMDGQDCTKKIKARFHNGGLIKIQMYFLNK